MLFKSVLIALAAASSTFAQNCGPKYGNQVCAPGNCCTFQTHRIHSQNSSMLTQSSQALNTAGVMYHKLIAIQETVFLNSPVPAAHALS